MNGLRLLVASPRGASSGGSIVCALVPLTSLVLVSPRCAQLIEFYKQRVATIDASKPQVRLKYGHPPPRTGCPCNFATLPALTSTACMRGHNVTDQLETPLPLHALCLQEEVAKLIRNVMA